MRQNPTAFEFNSSFLVALHYAVHTSEYGTFLCNSEKERLADHTLHTRTRCLWRAMARVAPRHANPRYAPVSGVLSVCTEQDAETTVAFFTQLYMPRCLPRDMLHNSHDDAEKTVAAARGGDKVDISGLPDIMSRGGDPEWKAIVTVTPPRAGTDEGKGAALR